MSLDYLLGRTNIRLSTEKIIYDRVKVPILVIDPQSGKIFDCNDIAVDFYGYEKVELLNMDIYAINILSREEIKEKMNMAVEKQKGIYRFKHRVADGSVKDVQIFSGPLLINNKKYLYSVIYDLSETIENEDNFESIENSLYPLLKVFNYKFPFKESHHKNAASFSVEIGKELGLGKKSLNILNIAGKIHDIGLLLLPAEIVNHNGDLNQSERSLYENHPVYGAELIDNISNKLSSIIRQHHEYIDGSGYPLGLTTEDILLEARILAVADIIDLLFTDYKKHLHYGSDDHSADFLLPDTISQNKKYNFLANKNLDTIEEIISYLEKYKGIRYDTDICDLAIELLETNVI